ncbi:MAG: hypothetical protein AABW46_02405 [Nanoarchaeota archaeon]
MKSRIKLFILILTILLISGCIPNIGNNKGKYFFINSLNFSCNIPNNLINGVSNLKWIKQDNPKIIGSICEAIKKECTAEIIIFRSNDNYLSHRIQYMGSPDDYYYLIYNNKEYGCVQKNVI